VLRHPPVVSRAVVRLSSSTVGSQHYCKWEMKVYYDFEE
jgi:hypothetical protein